MSASLKQGSTRTGREDELLLSNANLWISYIRPALPNMAKIFILSSLIKACIMMDAYRSVDFYIHLDWKDMVTATPMRNWYPHVLNHVDFNYPVFTGYFEYALGWLLHVISPESIKDAWFHPITKTAIAFQRLSVILIADLVLVVGATYLTCVVLSKTSNGEKSARLASSAPSGRSHSWILLSVTAYCLFDPSIFVVDHVHFQYNGLHLGLLMLSVGLLEAGKIRWSCISYTSLVLLKQIYLYSAVGVAAGVLVKVGFSPVRLFREAIVPSISVILLGLVIPCWVSGAQISKMFGSIFPFGTKEFCSAHHTAGNVCAALQMIDCWLFKRHSSNACSIRQLPGVHGIHFSEIVNIPPFVSAGAVLALNLLVIALWWKRNSVWASSRLESNHSVWITPMTSMCTWASYMVGWHIHEKAAMMFVMPLTVFAIAYSCCTNAFTGAVQKYSSNAFLFGLAVAWNCSFLLVYDLSRLGSMFVILGGLLLQTILLRMDNMTSLTSLMVLLLMFLMDLKTGWLSFNRLLLMGAFSLIVNSYCGIRMLDLV